MSDDEDASFEEEEEEEEENEQQHQEKRPRSDKKRKRRASADGTSEGDDDDDDDLQEDDEDEEGGEFEDAQRLNTTGASKFAAALKALTVGAQDSGPDVQVARKTKMMKELDAQKRAQLQARIVRQERKDFDTRALRKLPETDPALINRERDLRRTATRGVVALFNAIGAHQVSKQPIPKEKFTELLRKEVSKTDAMLPPRVQPTSQKANKAASAWKALQEDYADDMSSDEDGNGANMETEEQMENGGDDDNEEV